MYDTIEPSAQYSAKVRSLLEFHPEVAGGAPAEVDDPLYASAGAAGAAEVAAVVDAARIIGRCCEVCGRKGGAACGS